MNNLVNAVKKALKCENYYGALLIALALPDICGSLQHPNQKVGERYIGWFDNYLLSKYKSKIGSSTKEQTILSGADCYALRCSYLHAGSDEITQKKSVNNLDKFLFLTGGSHRNTLKYNGKSYLQLNVSKFCEDICNGVEAWLNDVSNDARIQNDISELIIIDKSARIGNIVKFG